MAGEHRARPQSEVAQSFGEDLDSVFGINNTLNGLSQSVEAKKQAVTSQSEELAAIENRLREAEERLARASKSQQSSRANSQARGLTSNTSTSAASRGQDYNTQSYGGAEAVPRSSQPGLSVYAGQENAQARQPRSEIRPTPPRGDSLGLPPIPGAMPQTPTERAYGNDYVSVDQRR